MITINIMNNEPMNAPARPLIAGELRESGFLNKLVLNVFSRIPFAFKSSASLRISGSSCCWSSGNERSMLPFNQTSTLASPKKVRFSFLPISDGSANTMSRKR